MCRGGEDLYALLCLNCAQEPGRLFGQEIELKNQFHDEILRRELEDNNQIYSIVFVVEGTRSFQVCS